MLSKLLKYEIKATGRIFLPLFLALLLFAGITRILSVFGPEKTPAVLSMVIYIAIMAGMFVMTLIMMIQRFYHNLLADEGYLMLTLPVKPWQHIVSKLLVSMFWIIASGIAAFISILMIAFRKGDIAAILSGFTTLYHQVLEQLGTGAYLLSIEMIIAFLITLASGILMVYAAIAIGHLFSSHKMLASFGAFIVLNTLTQIFFILVSLMPGTELFANLHMSPDNLIGMQHILQLALAFGIFYTVLLSAAYFAATNFILSKRLNLE